MAHVEAIVVTMGRVVVASASMSIVVKSPSESVKTCQLQKLQITSAGLDALVPRVIIFGVAGISALLEPGTTGRTTTRCAGFLGYAALGACRIIRLCCRYSKY